MKYSVCIEAVFNGLDFEDGMRRAKACGYDAFEFWTWWTRDVSEIARHSRELGMKTAAFCTKFVSLTDASKRNEYREALKQTLDAAAALDCGTIISQVGSELPGVPRAAQHASIAEGLAGCVPLLRDAGVTLVFEPLNTYVDHQGYYLWSSAEAFDIAREVGSPHVKVLYDIYHQQIMEGNLIASITKNIDLIGHFHAAGNPGRHELARGEINYYEVFRAIKGTGYQGYIGLEYFPTGEPDEGLRALINGLAL